jgi:peptide/nickel transport system substrate-binding protein
MRRRTLLGILLLVAVAPCFASSAPQPVLASEQLLVSTNEIGRYGGTLVVAERSEPKTLNPVIAADAPSREVIGCMTSDLVHINRSSQRTEPALAESWTQSRDGRTFMLQLRRGLRFSDGQPFDADDVVFSFQVYLDENVHSPQRDLLVVGGKPIGVEKLGSYAVRFTLAQPYAAAERIFDGLAMLPKHMLEKPYREGKFAQVWGVSTPATETAGMGPFRLKEYSAGQRIVLERNPYYWKIDRNKQRLPYLDELAFIFVGSEDEQILRFQAGDTDIISRVNAENYALLSQNAARRGYDLFDLGPSLEYNFLFFNLNDLTAKNLGRLAADQAWFSDVRFRQAVSAAVDREGIIKLAYAGRGTPLWGNVSPSNKNWVDPSLPHPTRSLDHARELLKSAGFSWRGDGHLVDRQEREVEFSIITSSSNAQRGQMATIVQDDLSKLGMNVHIVSLEFRAYLDRIFQSFDYEAAIMGLGGGDADPNPEINVWLSSGGTHVWHLNEAKPATEWEAQLDQLMQKQMVELNYPKRKRLYDEAQEIIAQNLPLVFLATANVLVGAKKGVGNFTPAILAPSTLWNVDQIYLRTNRAAGGRP